MNQQKIPDRKIVVAVLLLISIPCLMTTTFADVFKWRDTTGTVHITNIRPDWWTDEMNDMSFSEIQPPDQPTPFPGKFVGDKENRKFHLPTCEQIYTPEGKMAIPEEKIIWFDTTKDALDQNFFACSHCKPTGDSPETMDKPESRSGRTNQ